MKILVPMEFSEVALNALEYALKKDASATLIAVHVTKGLMSTDSIVLKPGMTKLESLEHELRQVIQEHITDPAEQKRIHVKVVAGDIIHQLMDMASSEGCNAIVMGTRDKKVFLDRWIGTVSLGVVKRAQIPVFLVPRRARRRPIRKVLCAADRYIMESDLLARVHRLNAEAQAYVRFLHIAPSDSDSGTTIQQKMVDFLSSRAQYPFEVEVLYDTDIASSLLGSAHELEADLLVLSPRQQSLISTWLFKSISKELVNKSDIPLVFLHS